MGVSQPPRMSAHSRSRVLRPLRYDVKVRNAMGKRCRQCGRELEGAPHRRYCSDACRMRGYRRRAKGLRIDFPKVTRFGLVRAVVAAEAVGSDRIQASRLLMDTARSLIAESRSQLIESRRRMIPTLRALRPPGDLSD